MRTAENHAHSATPLAIAAPLICAILQILTPILPQLGIGEPIGDQSDMVRSLVTPAGWAFSIWGPLYAGSTLFAVFQALPSQRENRLLAQILSIGVQKGPPIGVQKGPPSSSSVTGMTGALCALVGVEGGRTPTGGKTSAKRSLPVVLGVNCGA
jgi:hypothetical protein